MACLSQHIDQLIERYILPLQVFYRAGLMKNGASSHNQEERARPSTGSVRLRGESTTAPALQPTTSMQDYWALQGWRFFSNMTEYQIEYEFQP